MIERNAGVPEDRRIVFRIGIHVGDVVEESDGDLMGDGVNIAARLEGIATPGAICLSEQAYWQVKGRLDLAVTDLGPTQLKNIAEPVRAYSLHVGRRRSGKACACARTRPPRAPRQAFDRRASVPEHERRSDQEYFADGMVEDIITGLSRIKWLFVIARNSSFVYKGKAVDIRQVGRELGVRYVLEGGVRKAGNRLRITGQLIEAETGAHLWADKFDGTLDDVFALQDQITDRVVGIVEPSVQRSEIKRSRQKRPESLDAEDLVWRAMPHLQNGGPWTAVGRLCQATIRWPRGRSGLPGALHPSRRHRQQPADRAPRRRRHVQMEGLPDQRSRSAKDDDASRRRVHPPLT